MRIDHYKKERAHYRIKLEDEIPERRLGDRILNIYQETLKKEKSEN